MSVGVGFTAGKIQWVSPPEDTLFLPMGWHRHSLLAGQNGQSGLAFGWPVRVLSAEVPFEWKMRE